MFILKLWNYIRGYVIILVEGYFPEKFINICISRGILLWDVTREKSCIIKMKVSIEAFKKIRKVARKTRCRVKIIAKKGLPFVSYKYRKRKTFIAGCAIFLLMIYILSSFIWSIDIIGNNTISKAELIKKLNAVGFKTGVCRYYIDKEKICNEMMIQIKELAWISIDLSGTRAIVEISERVMPPKFVEKNVPCNIIADKDGIIKSIFVKAGTPLVKQQETVKKGDMLVSGIVINNVNISRFVHAQADIKARTWYEEIENVPLANIKEVKTGRVKNLYKFRLISNEISLGSNRPPFKNSACSTEEKLLSIGKNYIFPIGIVITKCEETIPVKEIITPDKAKEKGIKRAWGKINSQLGASMKVVDKKEYSFNYPDYVRTRVLVEAIESIGIEERISN
ncbi:MAG: sporulation protein YqfD [Deltaproteobacteria bacterium]